MAKFHYTGLTVPDSTRPWSPTKSVGSVRVSDKVRWVRSISTCTDFVRRSGRVRDAVAALKKMKKEMNEK